MMYTAFTLTQVLVIGSSDIFRATDIVQSYAKQGVVLLKKITIKPDSEESKYNKAQVLSTQTLRSLYKMITHYTVHMTCISIPAI